MKKGVFKKFTACLLCSLLCVPVATAFSGCGGSNGTSSESSATEGNLSLSAQNITLAIGETFTLAPVFANGNPEAIDWSSNNEGVATVTDGVVTGVTAGTAVIKATIANGDRAMCTVTVTNDTTKNALSVRLAYETAQLYVGDGLYLRPVVGYGNKTPEATLSFVSSAPSVVSVDNTGKLTALTAGNAKITVTATYLTYTATATCDVTVHSNGFYINPDFAVETIIEGDTLPLKISVSNAGSPTTDYEVSYASQDTSIATIENNVLKAVGHGDVAIEVTCKVGGKDYTFTQIVHVYGKFSVRYYNGGKLIKTETARYGDKVDFSFELITGRTFKYYTVNGVKTNSTSFVMPDGEVRVEARYSNQTDENFSSSFSKGTLFYNQGAVSYFTDKDLPVGVDGSKAYGGGAVRIDSPEWGSVQFDFEKSVEITNTATLKMRVYRPEGVSLIYVGNDKTTNVQVELGTGFSAVDGVPTSNFTHEVAANTWVEVEIPLTAFGAVGSTLNHVSVACSHNAFIYIDEICIQ